jgi:hypothetical protein
MVWPAAPALRGITMQLVHAGLRREGVPSTTRPVCVGELPRFGSAVLMNSITPPSLLAMVLRCYESNQGRPVG